MGIAKYAIELEWKEFSVCLNTLHAWLQANAGAEYCGMSAAEKLQVWFENEPSQEEKDAVSDHWEALDEESDEAANYMSAEDREAEKAAKRESAKAKLALLGLTAEEIEAIIG